MKRMKMITHEDDSVSSNSWARECRVLNRIPGFSCFAHPALPTARLDFKKCYGYGSVIANKNEGLLALEFAFI